MFSDCRDLMRAPSVRQIPVGLYVQYVPLLEFNLRRAAGVPQSSGLAEVSLGIILLFLFLLFWAHTRLLVPSNLSNLLLAWHL
jgi:hypothetical protein